MGYFRIQEESHPPSLRMKGARFFVVRALNFMRGQLSALQLLLG